MKNLFKKLALLLAAVLCISCMFAGLTMAGDAAQTADAADSAGESADSEGESSEEDYEEAMAAFGKAMGEVMAESGEAEGNAEEAEAAGGSDSGESSGEFSPEALDLFFSDEMLALFGLEEYAGFDFEEFYTELNEKIENGEKVTLEEAYPEVLFAYFAALMNMGGEDYSVAIFADQNEMVYCWMFDDVIDEESAQAVIDSVTESYESQESKQDMKDAMEQLSEAYNIDVDEIKMTLVFFNGDDSVIYDKTYTYESLTADLEEAEEAEEAVEDVIAE